MANKSNHFLFVYGSLLSGFKSPAYDYISRYFDLIGSGSVNGLMFDMGEYPAAVPAEEPHRIQGELYRIKNAGEFSWAMGQLDDYEGVLVEQGEKPLYRRELTSVLIDGDTVMAWIYWYNGDVSGRPAIESGSLIDYITRRRQ